MALINAQKAFETIKKKHILNNHNLRAVRNY